MFVRGRFKRTQGHKTGDKHGREKMKCIPFGFRRRFLLLQNR